MMRYLFLLALISNYAMALSMESTISGKVEAITGCSKKAMVWLSLDKENYKERLLLMHTEVPQGGSFRFFVKPGDYQVRGSDESGCEFVKKITVRGEDHNVLIKLVKK